MKQLFILLFTFFSFSAIYSQNEDDKDSVFSLSFEFSGEISEKGDSTFIVYYLVDKKEFKEMKKYNIYSYRRDGSSSINIIDVSDKTKIINERKHLKIKIGKSNPNIKRYEIICEDKLGNSKKLKIKESN